MRAALLCLVLIGCSETISGPPEPPATGPVLHIGNGSNEAVFVFYRAADSDTWIWAAEMPAHSGLCLRVVSLGATVLRAEGRTSATSVADTADLTTSADWLWDFVVPSASELKPITQFCPTA